MSAVRRGRVERLGTLVPKVMNELGFEATARVLRVAERWEEAVGPEIARHCRPTALRGEVLEASVDSSVWCQQLQLRAPEILQALERVLGAESPRELWLRVAERPLGGGS